MSVEQVTQTIDMVNSRITDASTVGDREGVEANEKRSRERTSKCWHCQCFIFRAPTVALPSRGALLSFHVSIV
jgi:hypothetical protein